MAHGKLREQIKYRLRIESCTTHMFNEVGALSALNGFIGENILLADLQLIEEFHISYAGPVELVPHRKLPRGANLTDFFLCIFDCSLVALQQAVQIKLLQTSIIDLIT